MEVFPGAEFEVDFSLRNLSENEASFKTVAVVSVDGKETLLGSDIHNIKPVYGKKIKELFTAPNKTVDFKFGLRVTTGSTSRTYWIDAKCVPLEFELVAPKTEYEFNLNKPVHISVVVSHKYDSPLHIVSTIDVLSDAIDTASEFSSQSIDINPKVQKTVNFPLIWNREAAKPDEIYEVKISVRCKDNLKEQSIFIKALDYIPPEVFISHIENDDMKETSIYGSINWNDLTPDRVEIDWGDGTVTDDGSSFPFSHVYERWGSYKIKIKAISEEGSVKQISERDICEEPPPPPPIITSVEFDREMPDEYTIELELEVDWRDYGRGKIQISWGDGEEDKSSRTSFRHEYPSDTGSLIDYYIMTIKAVTRDGLESPTRKFSVTMLGGIMCFFGEIK